MDASEVVAAYAAAWNDGDTELGWSYFADDVVMRLPGRGALAGEHHRREAVLAAIRAMLVCVSYVPYVLEQALGAARAVFG